MMNDESANRAARLVHASRLPVPIVGRVKKGPLSDAEAGTPLLPLPGDLRAGFQLILASPIAADSVPREPNDLCHKGRGVHRERFRRRRYRFSPGPVSAGVYWGKLPSLSTRNTCLTLYK